MPLWRRAWMALPVLCAVIYVLFSPRAARALPEETFVVAIGNNRGDGDDVQLLYAERDVRELVDILRTQGQVASDRVRLLINEDAATARRTLLALNAALRSEVEDQRRRTALVVFYSGHADAEALHLRGSRLAFDELRALVASSPAAIRLLIVDACRSGAVTRVKGVRAAPEFQIGMNDRLEAEGMAILSSSAAGESSQESDRLRASFFSHHLVNALRGAADRDGDGRVTLAETYAYTYAETLRSSGTTLSLQHPTYAYDVKGSGDLVLTTAEGSRGSGQLRLGPAGTYLITEEREAGPVVAELRARRDRAVLMLPRGRYFVQQRGAEEFREYRVQLEPGAIVDLQQVPSRLLRYDLLVRKGGGARRSRHGLSVLLAGRGQLLAGEGATLHPLLGYQVDLPWLTLAARLQGTTVGALADDGGLPRRRWELGIGIVAQRFVDLPWFSVAFGVSLETALHRQIFSSGTRTAIPGGTALTLGFTGLFALERSLWRGLGLRLEVGPTAVLLKQATVDRGAQTGVAQGSAVSFWTAGGFTWRI